VGEFGRYLPYQTKNARPVVGSEGLIASAWHWTWERHGAPQLNQRFGCAGKFSSLGQSITPEHSASHPQCRDREGPIDGFLHEKNNLDTLGIDGRESTCRFR